MKHGSLFSGIGGFDLAAQWMGWENIFHCEWMPFPRKVLNHYWPNSISYEDITKTDFSIHRGNIDILTGGFPCQPYSAAGKRKGTEDDRHLWPEMLRAIREIQPRYVVGENVRGLTNWNGGLVFDQVQADLEAEGYEVTPFLLPACAVNAPHRRDRIWFVAYRESNGFNGRNSEHEINTGEGGFNALDDIESVFTKNTHSNKWGGDKRESESGIRQFGDIGTGDNEWLQADNGQTDATDTPSSSTRPSGTNRETEGNGRKDNDEPKGGGTTGELNIRCGELLQFTSDTESHRQEYALENGKLGGERFRKSYKRNMWDSFPSKPPICGGDDGIPRKLDGITFSKWRQESVKAYGNAIVPQVSYEIFKAIELCR